jgi:hypothetical protein
MKKQTSTNVQKKTLVKQKIDWRSPKRLPYYGNEQTTDKEES